MNRVFSTLQMRLSALPAALLIVAAALLVLGPSPGLGAVLYSTDFESDAASTVVNPDPSGDFDPAGFSVSEPTINSVQVASYVGAGGPPSVAGGSNYLRLTRPSGGYNVYSLVGNGAAPYYVKFDAYIVTPATYGGLYVRINGSSEQVAVGIAGAQNQFNYLAGGWNAIPGAFVTFDTWKTVGFQVNSMPGTYDLYYDNAVVATGLPYNAATGGQFEFAFGLENTDRYFVDNFEIGTGTMPPVIPEPMSACLLGTGLVGLLACGRRKRR